MKRPVKNIILLLTIGLLDACSISQATPNPVMPTVTASVPESQDVFSEVETKTLTSLKQIDDYPLYLMQYYWEYTSYPSSSRSATLEAEPTPGWDCSLFTVLLDDNHLLYGRNFHWDFSPAVLAFTYPPDGYASISMVSIGMAAVPLALRQDQHPFERDTGFLAAMGLLAEVAQEMHNGPCVH